MHEETYPDFFTPRDKEPSLSSSEEKSSEFDWLEIKRTRKQKQSKCSVFYFLPKTVQRMRLWEQAPEIRSDRSIIDIFCKGKYKLFIRGFSPFVFT